MGLLEFLLSPHPLRIITKKIIRTINYGNYVYRVNMGNVNRPHYAYCVYNGALLAKKLGYSGISVLEFGVAGGKGLLNLEECAKKLRKLLSIEIDIYGFDTGKGLPEPLDYRDLPYQWKSGFYKMDVPKLEKKLETAKLILGDVKQTVKSFVNDQKPRPIGAIMFDLDFYSSTANALRIFQNDQKFLLPRIFCYFDDVIGTEVELYNDFTGARLAINEFNNINDKKKLSPAYHLLNKNIVEDWHHQIRIFHDFDHFKYNKMIGSDNQQLKI